MQDVGLEKFSYELYSPKSLRGGHIGDCNYLRGVYRV